MRPNVIEAGIPYLYDPSMQLPRLDRADLEKGCRGARILAGNDYEFGMMADKLGVAEADLRRMVPITVMTRGEAGALITVDDQEFDIPPARPKAVVDPTGPAMPSAPGSCWGCGADGPGRWSAAWPR